MLVQGEKVQGSVAPERVTAQRLITACIVFIPTVALVLAVVRMWGHGVGVREVVVGVLMYFAIGHGVAVGYHRLFTHKSFRARRALKIILAVAGSMAFEGGPIGWVADHRRHHAFTDRDGDPHSPVPTRPGVGGVVRGLWHAHVGWLFSHRPTDVAKYAGELLHDRDIVVVNRLFPLWCVVSLGLPFTLGWVLGGSISAAATTLLWAGLVRVFALHHMTWSVNSICHTFGRRPFRTKDRSANVAALALISFGESWHNAHHAFPTSARLGIGAHQYDTSAAVIMVFERLGWVDHVRRADPDRIALRAAA